MSEAHPDDQPEKLSGPGAGLSATGPTVPGEAQGSDYGDPGGTGTAEEEADGAG